MTDVGDRIAVTSKGEPRSGVVTSISGVMITVRWDTGGETSLIPGPGVLRVVKTAAPSKKAAAGKKPAAKGTSSTRTTGKKTS